MDSSSAHTLGVSLIIAGYLVGNGIRNGLVCFNKGEVHKDEHSLFKMQNEDILQQKFVKRNIYVSI